MTYRRLKVLSPLGAIAAVVVPFALALALMFVARASWADWAVSTVFALAYTAMVFSSSPAWAAIGIGWRPVVALATGLTSGSVLVYRLVRPPHAGGDVRFSTIPLALAAVYVTVLAVGAWRGRLHGDAVAIGNPIAGVECSFSLAGARRS